jgi:4-amino-4-deoxy-L-arabinose transferase-like glycosyltransferase
MGTADGRGRLLLAVVLGYYALSAAAFAGLNAPGNAPDEPAHAAYAAYWHHTGELPVCDASPFWPRYEAVQPPLYYALLRPVYAVVQHRPAGAQFRAMRAVSAALHLLALWLVFRIALRAFAGARGPALGATAVVALTPMFAFIGGSVTNDALANLAMAAVLLAGLRLEQAPADRRAVALYGLALGLGFSAKMSLVLPGLAVTGFLVWRGRLSPRQAAAALGLALLVASHAFWRNWRDCGDPLSAARLQAVEPVAAGWGDVGRWGPSSYESFWAVFGWMTVRVPAFFYRALWALGGLAAAGLFLGRRDDGLEPRAKAFLGFALALVLAQGAFFCARTLQAQGRYLFIGLGAFAPLFFAGLAHWARRLSPRLRPAAWAALVLFALALQWASLSALVSQPFVVPGVHNPKGI